MRTNKSILSTIERTLLDAARGVGTRERRLRCFPLSRYQIRPSLGTPSMFHQEICEKIRNAKDRVYLASLYIGPAANPKSSPKEKELLEALADSKASTLRILLDRNRALRKVPLADSNSTTCSAAACDNVMQSAGRELRLFSVLSPLQQRLLPNPYNEVAGVFHIKCYIVDDEFVMTGANLSEEYFSDRTDRYLWISARHKKDEKSLCLVEFYADLFDALWEHATPFPETGKARSTFCSDGQLVQRLTHLLTEDVAEVTTHCEDEDVDAFAVPTFQAPRFSGGANNSSGMPTDTEVIENVLRAAAGFDVRLASAYLNLTESTVQALKKAHHVHLLTAGSLSHGFKPNPKKVGNKGTPWIPSCFDVLARNSMVQQRNCSLWYYQRENWTFHAKGLWLSPPGTELPTVVTHGSGNYGYRSAFRDMESNLILVLPEQSPLRKMFHEEWNSFFAWGRHSSQETPASLPWKVDIALPIIRKFL